MSEVSKCPKCGGQLVKGYIYSPKGIYWDTKKHDWTVLFSEEIVSEFALTIPKEEASRCENCRLVLFSY